MIQGKGTTEEPLLCKPVQYQELEIMEDVETDETRVIIILRDGAEDYVIALTPLDFELMARKGLGELDDSP